ncbi:hypothetical protein [Leisingera caerulea]|uniref:Uncharacterized protein n=1 Tax=Leisingera caerulea TaxID=506591 RepID=A0A9Q9HMN2_LEICA|nr:hypothetical protein [Leisingera caerulea]UWQ55000.1 hypothetical protein K3721_05555 [Leisingera caerulea]
MNNRTRVCTASVVGGGIAITIMIGIISALIHLAGWIGDRYRARRRAAQEK